MSGKKGQVALYLALVLVAITMLILMNVGAFLGVSAHNKTMNGGDAAAVEVARHQRELLNQIGELNIAHLKSAILNATNQCEQIVTKQKRLCLLGPLDGIRRGNEAAQKYGCRKDERMADILRRHADDISRYVAPYPDVFPEAWKNSWYEYANELKGIALAGIWAGPENADFVTVPQDHMLLNQGFYDAIKSRNWCWFKCDCPAAWAILNTYESFRDWAPMDAADPESRRRKCVNSEIYSLDLMVIKTSALKYLGPELIVRLTGVDPEALEDSELIKDPEQEWFLYDYELWRQWKEIDPNGETPFPIMGRIKPEYDIRGCAAICRVTCKFLNLLSDSKSEREAFWCGAAKPFGAVINEDGELTDVTGLRRFVTPCFETERLVPLDTVGGENLATADYDWMLHVTEHLPRYMNLGPRSIGGCDYCAQLKTWENREMRAYGIRWLKLNGHNCVRSVSGSGGTGGGTSHGH